MTNFGAAQILCDSSSSSQLQSSTRGKAQSLTSAPPDSSAVHDLSKGKRKVSKEDGQRILREATKERSQPSLEEVAKALETLQLETNTSPNVQKPLQDGATATVTIPEVGTDTTTSENEQSAPATPRRKSKKQSVTKSGSRDLTLNSSPPTLSRPLSTSNSDQMRPTSLLVASLGNPPPYHSTRHSAAHIIIKHLQITLGLPAFNLKSRPYGGGHVSIGADVGRPEITLWQSPSLMNISGPPLLKAWKHFLSTSSPSQSDPIKALVILHDEMETDSGRVKLKKGNTSARGHNGLKSVQASLKSAGLLEGLADRYVKIGVGIGRPSGGSREPRDVSAYVLGQLTASEKEGLENATGELAGILYQEIARIGQSAG